VAAQRGAQPAEEVARQERLADPEDWARHQGDCRRPSPIIGPDDAHLEQEPATASCKPRKAQARPAVGRGFQADAFPHVAFGTDPTNCWRSDRPPDSA
jgi:hypothetical protein